MTFLGRAPGSKTSTAFGHRVGAYWSSERRGRAGRTRRVADDASLWIKELLTEAAMGARKLTERELAQVIEHVALAGFEPNELETVRGRLAGITWNGRTLRGNDRLP